MKFLIFLLFYKINTVFEIFKGAAAIGRESDFDIRVTLSRSTIR